MPTPHRPGPHGPRVRRGLTFVEVLCAVGILALAAAAMLSASSAVMNGQSRGLKRLGAAELANRLMLQYLDDEESLPSETAPIEYGRDTYRWTKRVSGLLLESAVPQDPQRSGGAMSLDRLQAVTFTVWNTDEVRGLVSREDGTPSYSITRIVDPVFGQLRNPDTRARIMDDPVLRQRFIDMITGRGAQGTSGKTPPKPPAAPSRSDKK
ncbi:MAG: prepilin-type N-terminal cleavage/methylation domain-containing protein [Phycisphaerales bacterium]